MAVTTRRLSAEAIFDTPEDDGSRYEILAGELYVTASPSRRHAKVKRRLGRWLDTFVEANGLGEVYINPVDVRLTPFDVVAPDLIYLSSERLHLFDERWVSGSPDLIVEALSPSTRGRDLNAKFQLYSRTGVREYWLIDPDANVLTVYGLAASGSYELIEHEDGKLRSCLLPAFELTVAGLFEGIE